MEKSWKIWKAAFLMRRQGKCPCCKYIRRVTDKRNLEANILFVKLVEEVHKERNEGNPGWCIQSLRFI